jgi:hypothetical protein
LPIKLQDLVNRNKIDQARKYVLKIYKCLDSSKDKKLYKDVEAYITNLPEDRFIKRARNKELIFQFIAEPFTNISFDQIVECADTMGIPLEERIWIPEMNAWTKKKVPVGFTYIQAMEQLGTDYESVRGSTGKYMALTGQPGDTAMLPA